MKPPRTSMPVLLPFVLLALALPASAGAQDGGNTGSLPPQMAQVLGHPSLSEATVGIVLQDAETGEVLIDFNADQLFAPASVNKLFTVAAALWRLGPAFVWQTPIAYRGQRVGEGSETLDGDLWALGRGAPDTVEEQLWLASRAIYRRGIVSRHR